MAQSSKGPVRCQEDEKVRNLPALHRTSLEEEDQEQGDRHRDTLQDHHRKSYGCCPEAVLPPQRLLWLRLGSWGSHGSRDRAPHCQDCRDRYKDPLEGLSETEEVEQEHNADRCRARQGRRSGSGPVASERSVRETVAEEDGGGFTCICSKRRL